VLARVWEVLLVGKVVGEGCHRVCQDRGYDASYEGAHLQQQALSADGPIDGDGRRGPPPHPLSTALGYVPGGRALPGLGCALRVGVALARAACESEPLDATALRMIETETFCDHADDTAILLCRTVQQLMREILASPVPV